jgi:hypothetical protein
MDAQETDVRCVRILIMKMITKTSAAEPAISPVRDLPLIRADIDRRQGGGAAGAPGLAPSGAGLGMVLVLAVLGRVPEIRA